MIAMSLFSCGSNSNSDELPVDTTANSGKNINIWPVLDIEVKKEE